MDDVIRSNKDKSVIYSDGNLIPALFLASHHPYQAVELTL
jgi:hypothetical protein